MEVVFFFGHIDSYGTLVHMYAMIEKPERIQTGIRIEKRLLKVLKGLAESLDMSVGDLIEGIALHSFENKPPFTPQTLKKIRQLKEVYDLDWTAEHSHKFAEAKE
ncbi:hypothetical protein CLV75_3789 [Ruegeria conchae]|uniref:Uncharacterized protein n=2 Tax=Ruegeria conchae TaxID=981384 RepID=A0A497Z9F6_9RHOB|nr:hypothetical protein CLV75_3789 [Ruegeria conchae]